jgi:hypothetical protein
LRYRGSASIRLLAWECPAAVSPRHEGVVSAGSLGWHASAGHKGSARRRIIGAALFSSQPVDEIAQQISGIQDSFGNFAAGCDDS